MHQMGSTSKMLTIVGLVVEGLAILFFTTGTIIFRAIAQTPKEDLIGSGWSELDAQVLLAFSAPFSIVLMVLGILITVMFVINVVIFRRLMKELFTEKQAKRVYMYQAIWGGVCILFNTITGVLYLISAVKSQERSLPHKESKYQRTKAREGL